MQSEIKDYLDIIVRRKWLFITMFSLSIVSGLFYVASQPDQFVSSAVFQYQQKHPIMLLLVKDETTLTTITQSVTSNNLIKRIQNDMELFKSVSARLSDAFPENGSFDYNLLPTRYFFSVESENNALIKVEFISNNKNLTYQAINIFLEELARLEKQRDKTLVEKARRELQSALDQKRTQVEELNDKIILFLTSEAASDETRNKASAGSLPEARRLSQIERYISQLEFSKDTIRDYDEKRAQQTALQAQISQMGVKYTDQNPILVRLKEQLQQLNEDIENHAKNLGYLLTLNEVELRREASELKSFLQKHKSDENIPTVSPREKQIQSEIQLKHEEILHLSRRLDDLLLIESSLDEKITVLSDPILPESPLGIQKTKIITLSLLIGALVALMACAVMEQLDDHILSSREIEQLTNLDNIVSIPYNAEKFTDAVTIYKKAIDYFLQVATFIRAGGGSRGPIMVFVTSSMPEEGKTTISTGLALAMSETSRTLLIDCDFRNPTIKKFFDVKAEHGIIHSIMYGIPMEDSIVPSFKENLDIFPCSEMTKNPSRIFLSDKFKEMIETLGREYSVIIIDTPPVSVAPDVFALSSMGMEGLLIADMDSCRKSGFIKTLKTLKTFRVSMLGMILNKVSTDIRYGYYSRYSYRNYDRMKRYKDSPAEKS